MKNGFLSLVILSVQLFASCAQSQVTVITNVNVFDGETLMEGMDFVFSDSQVIQIVKHKARLGNETIIEGAGHTILPALINAHVHIAKPENLKEALGVGIFAMMDMFTTDGRANYLRTFRDSLQYAYYYSSNIGATVPNGHGTQYGVQIPTINDSVSASNFVKERISLGADYIKLTQEHTMAKLSEAQVREITQTAHQHHRIVIAHISELNDGKMLAQQQVDGFAHIWYRGTALATAETLQEWKDQQLFIIPTLSVIEKVMQNSDSSELKKLLAFEQVLEEVNKAYQQGIPILAGTDARNYGMNYTTQLFDEFMLLSKSGMSNIDVLKAGTSNIYKAFGLKEFGNLAINSPANFILVKGNPCTKLSDIYNEKRIWRLGKEMASSS